MKAIINGKRFDTEKAILIGTHIEQPIDSSYWETYPHLEMENWEASLYRTPQSGRFFLAGKGNKKSPFFGLARYTGDDKERIVPITQKEAFAWAEKYLTQDEIESGFADLIEEA